MADNYCMRVQQITATTNLNKLINFRQAVYNQLGPARDSLFELGDAVLLSPQVRSFPELTLSPIFRRKWSSSYEAIEDGRPPRIPLLHLYLDSMRNIDRPVLAGDHTAWPRLTAPTLRDRTFEHQPTAVPGAKPVTVGHGFSTLAWVPEEQGSWSLPLLHERIPSSESRFRTMARQISEIWPKLAARMIVLLDAEYGCAPFLKETEGLSCDFIIRLRQNLCLRKAPRRHRGKGRPALHGKSFRLKDPRTWGMPMKTLGMWGETGERIHLDLWANLHLVKAPRRPFFVLRVEFSDRPGTRRRPREIWLAWVGQEPPAMEDWWNLYFRRFAVDHWYRFAKQSLGWTTPLFRTPEQEERWSDLMPVLTWQLYLSRNAIQDRPLPWQRSQAAPTPGRVKQSLGGLWARIGTPTREPKPRGKAPGWIKGRPRIHLSRFSIVRKC
jgi:hypothetical protein